MCVHVGVWVSVSIAGDQSKALHFLGKHFTTELHPQPGMLILPEIHFPQEVPPLRGRHQKSTGNMSEGLNC